MKILPKLTLALLSVLFVVPAFAGSGAGDDSARYYKSNPEKFDGKKVDVDVAFVTRINRKDRVDGVAFFVAHTVDEDNNSLGGAIVVAVLDDDTDSFMRKYGTAVERRGKGVDSKRLRGVFHLLKGGRVYIDESGEAQAIIEAHIQKNGDAAIPGDEDRQAGGKKNKKNKKKGF